MNLQRQAKEKGNKKEKTASRGRSSKKNNIDPDAYKIISVRMRMAEFVCFAEQVEKSGLSNNGALRVAARRIAGFLEADSETRKTLKEITDQIGNIADDINSLRRVAINNEAVDIEKFIEYRVAFGQEFARLDAQLQKILNVSRRRIDGRVMLKDAVDA